MKKRKLYPVVFRIAADYYVKNDNGLYGMCTAIHFCCSFLDVSLSVKTDHIEFIEELYKTDGLFVNKFVLWAGDLTNENVELRKNLLYLAAEIIESGGL